MEHQARALPARPAARRHRPHGLAAAPGIIAIIGTTALGAVLVGSTITPGEIAQPVEVEPVALADAVEQPPAIETIIIEERDVAEVESDIRWFDNRPIRPVRTITMLVTAYSPDEQSCGIWADGITASGYSVRTNGGKLVAADTRLLPFGSLVSIPGYDSSHVVPVLDRGGAIKGNRLDVLYPTHNEAMQWGVQRLEVTVWEYADGGAQGLPRRSAR